MHLRACALVLCALACAATALAGPKTPAANGGYPLDVPTNRCDRCKKRYPTRSADAARYKTQPYAEHIKTCRGEGRNGGYPDTVPTNRCPSCKKRFPTATADAARYGTIPWRQHIRICGKGANEGPEVDVFGQGTNADGPSSPGSPGSPGEPIGPNPPEGDGTPPASGADAAVHWARDVGPHKGNPGEPGKAPPTCWDGWCFRYVSWAWHIGAGRSVAFLTGPDATTGLHKCRGAGLLRDASGSIPKGAPVFWDCGGPGHVAIATGKKAGGVPTVISTKIGGRSGIFEAPLSWFTPYIGRPAGWGLVK